MQLSLRIIAILSFGVAIIWMFVAPGFEPLLALLAGISTLMASLALNSSKDISESLDQHNRRIMLNFVESFWIKGILENSLHGAALIDLELKEDVDAIDYPWTLEEVSTNRTLATGKPMLEIYKEIGAERSLLILGIPGSGKTTLLLKLTRELIERARRDEAEPIPVVFNLASWTERQSITSWLASQLNRDYSVARKTAMSWINGNRMILLLDGLDEVKSDSRVKCVDAINEFRSDHGLISLVVCSRIEEYEALNAKFEFEGAIKLQSLTYKQIASYFDRFGQSLKSVKQLLEKDRFLQELAQTPLMLSIITLAYKNRDADTLIAAGDFEKQRRYLFNAYINRMFEHSFPRRVKEKFSKRLTVHYLHWLSQVMTANNIVTFQIESIQPAWLELQAEIDMFLGLFWLIFEVLFGLIFAIIGLLMIGSVTGVLFGAVVGLIAGLIFGVSTNQEIIMVEKLKWSWDATRQGLVFVLIFGLSAIIGGWQIAGPVGALIGGLIAGPTTTLFLGLSSEQMGETSYPGQGLKQTLLNVGFVGLIVAMNMGLVYWMFINLSHLLNSDQLTVKLIGILSGGLSVAMGAMLIYSLLDTLISAIKALIQHFALRFIFTQSQSLPWEAIPLLKYAVELFFMRRVGGGYAFVHRLLMKHFAELNV